MTSRTKSEQLFSLADAVADAILDMSEDEILAELEAEDVSAVDAGKAFDSLADSARIKAGRREFENARRQLEESKRQRVDLTALNSAQVRAMIKRATLETNELTQAARNATTEQMSDDEALDYLEDLIELGFNPTTESGS